MANPKGNPTHGLSKKYPREYKSWKSARERCLNPSHAAYPSYGGRGIWFCTEWDDFSRFLKDMGVRPEGCSLGRIDNDGDYRPGNCRWEASSQQARNRSSSRRFSLGDDEKVMADWVDDYGSVVGAKLAYRRVVELGWDVESAVSTPPRKINYPARTDA